MNKTKVAINMFSSWSYMLCMIGAAFVVSPILVNKLGNENYGVWTLIVSITGYFSILDFGILTAIVRFISLYKARGHETKAREIFSNACIFFAIISALIIVFTFVFGYFFSDVFEINSMAHVYVYTVFIFAGLEFACTMFFGVLSASLHATQEFIWMNAINIIMIITKNIILVTLLFLGYNLLTIAVVHFLTSLVRSAARYLVVKIKHNYLYFKRADYSKTIFNKLFNYSIYSFIIAVAIKIMFFTDSVVIGSMISVSEVTFYAIAMSLMTYLEQFSITGISVLTPIISSNEAIGDSDKNVVIYTICSRYSLGLILPILFVLYTKGDIFIGLWMGPEYSSRCGMLIKILSVSYLFYLSQTIAVELLKGISRHKILAIILIAEAFLNLVLSIFLANLYGITGVAFGTAIPLIIANLFAIPLYTCMVLKISYWRYICESYGKIIIFTLLLAVFINSIQIFDISSYSTLFLYAFLILTIYIIFTYIVIIEPHHKLIFLNKIGFKK